MGKIIVKKISAFEHILDIIMRPIMIFLGKFKADSIQETHVWHSQEINPNLIDIGATVKMPSNDDSIYKKYCLFLFHAPLLGGWTKYTVFEIGPKNKPPFFIGWIDHKKSKAFVNRLPIYGRRIRFLNCTNLFDISAFAISSDGTQIPINKIKEGKLGTGIDKDIRLF